VRSAATVDHMSGQPASRPIANTAAATPIASTSGQNTPARNASGPHRMSKPVKASSSTNTAITAKQNAGAAKVETQLAAADRSAAIGPRCSPRAR
jgi:hypothetical protein